MPVVEISLVCPIPIGRTSTFRVKTWTAKSQLSICKSFYETNERECDFNGTFGLFGDGEPVAGGV